MLFCFSKAEYNTFEKLFTYTEQLDEISLNLNEMADTRARLGVYQDQMDKKGVKCELYGNGKKQTWRLSSMVAADK